MFSATTKSIVVMLFQHRDRTAYQDEDDRVFCHPQTGGPLDTSGTQKRSGPRSSGERSSVTFGPSTMDATRQSRTRRLLDCPPRRSGARAGHSDFKTTQGYIDLAGETFRAEVELLEQRLFGTTDRQTLGVGEWELAQERRD